MSTSGARSSTRQICTWSWTLSLAARSSPSSASPPASPTPSQGSTLPRSLSPCTTSIIYRDLKPENILLGADGHVKMTDFGFSKVVPHVTSTLCGTPDYLAPEIVEGKLYNKSVDWYALGILVYEMLAGYPPFFATDPQPNPFKLYELIIAGNVVYPQYFDPRATDLIKRFITADVTERYGNLKYGAKDIFAHDWFGEVPWERLCRKEIPAPYVPKIEGDGDASQFARYNENNTLDYGRGTEDLYGHLFRDFEYSTPA